MHSEFVLNQNRDDQSEIYFYRAHREVCWNAEANHDGESFFRAPKL